MFSLAILQSLRHLFWQHSYPFLIWTYRPFWVTWFFERGRKVSPLSPSSPLTPLTHPRGSIFFGSKTFETLKSVHVDAILIVWVPVWGAPPRFSKINPLHYITSLPPYLSWKGSRLYAICGIFPPEVKFLYHWKWNMIPILVIKKQFSPVPADDKFSLLTISAREGLMEKSCSVKLHRLVWVCWSYGWWSVRRHGQESGEAAYLFWRWQPRFFFSPPLPFSRSLPWLYLPPHSDFPSPWEVDPTQQIDPTKVDVTSGNCQLYPPFPL